MSQPDDRRTEPPTDRRLRRARDEGDVPFSRDVSSAVVLAAVLLATWIGRDELLARLSTLGNYALESPARIAQAGSGSVALNSAIDIFMIVAGLVFPLAMVAALAAIAVDLWQTRGLFTFRAIRPRLEKLNPAEGFKRIFSLRNAVELIKTIIKITALASVLFLVIRWSLQTMVKLPALTVDGVMSVSAVLFAVFFCAATLVLALAAAFDLWFQQVDYIRRNRMTPEEVRRERRDDLGDPHMRAQRRRIAMQEAGETLLERTAKATLIVNAAAERVAVALRVDPANVEGAWLLNKGSQHVALAILAIGRESGIRVVDDASFTLKIYRDVAIDADVPAELQNDLARLLR